MSANRSDRPRSDLALAGGGILLPAWLAGLTHAAETPRSIKPEAHKELRPPGVNIAAVPFIVLGYTRPRWLLGLVAIAGAMVAFGTLDVREAFHQSRTGLLILAAVIAALHFAAAGIASVMAARRRAPGSPGAAGTIPV
jgi:hypothetical protein